MVSEKEVVFILDNPFFVYSKGCDQLLLIRYCFSDSLHDGSLCPTGTMVLHMVLINFDCHFLIVFVVETLKHLAESTFIQFLQNLKPVAKMISYIDFICSSLPIESIVVILCNKEALRFPLIFSLNSSNPVDLIEL